MDRFPDIAIDQVVLQEQKFKKDMSNPSIKRGCSNVRAFLSQIVSDQDVEVLYWNEDQQDWMTLDSTTEEEDMVQIRGDKKIKQVHLQIIYKTAPNIFDENAFFRYVIG